ncbi:hypothetical protein ARMGADRAFT_1017895 [Armillaria gallica]|uniref:Uncharacterized protein n=1 Tax=Armillaria gallica TaxID=47427 RepID=A0A2H3CVK7_ARMGA|nr:hypothetical protein ARMGADRAFT_1017895 [Armillaria gallica]
MIPIDLDYRTSITSYGSRTVSTRCTREFARLLWLRFMGHRQKSRPLSSVIRTVSDLPTPKILIVFASNGHDSEFAAGRIHLDVKENFEFG